MSRESDEPALLIYDGECGFCTYWAKRWREKSSEAIAIAPLQDETGWPSAVTRQDLEQAVHLVEHDEVYRGAEAVFKVLAYGRWYGWLLWLYRYMPGVGPMMEWGYRWVANHRQFVSRWTRWLRRH